jgi:ribosomal protein S9
MEMLAVKTVASTHRAEVVVQEKLAAQIALVMVAMGVSIHNLALMAHLLVSLLVVVVAVQQGPGQAGQAEAVVALLAKALVLPQL